MSVIWIVSFITSSILTFQLPLSLSLRDDASFENFYESQNSAAVKQIKNSTAAKSSDGSIYLWGSETSGKTHLLEAACHQATKLNRVVVYIPLKHASEFKISMLENLETCGLICIDDVDLIAGQSEWEQAIFYLYNRAYETGAQLVFSASKNVKECNFTLPDLVSRLGWGFVFHIHVLADEEKAAALQMRAKLRGFDLPDNVVRYLLRRLPRDMNALFGLLDELDKASLTAQRKLTVPFIKQWFNERENILQDTPLL